MRYPVINTLMSKIIELKNKIVSFKRFFFKKKRFLKSLSQLCDILVNLFHEVMSRNCTKINRFGFVPINNY